MNCQERLEAYLRQNQVAFKVQHHPIAYTAQDVAAKEHISGRLVAKVVMALSDGKMVMAVLPAPVKLDLPKLAKVIGVKEAKVASESDFAALFRDCEVGAMPPFGNLYGLPVYVDQSLTADESIVFQAGTHTDTISLAYADYARLVNPIVADIGRRLEREAAR